MTTQKKFISPSEFTGDIPGRGRKPSKMAQEIAKLLKGCPVGKGLELTLPETKQTTSKGQARVRGQITTASKMAGWSKAGIQWTTKGSPFVTRVA
jgi:hypothetical protein